MNFKLGTVDFTSIDMYTERLLLKFIFVVVVNIFLVLGGTETTLTTQQEVGSTVQPEGTVTPEVEGTVQPEGTVTPEVEGTGEPEGIGTPEVEGTGEPEGIGTPEVEGTGKPEGTGTPEVEGTGEPEGTGTPKVEVIGQPESEGVEQPEEEIEPEPEIGGTAEVVIFVTLYSLIIVFIIAGNAIVVAVIVRNKRLRQNTSNLFLMSLVTARASIGVFVVPAKLTGLFSEEYLGSILCKLCHFAALGSSVASILSICTIAIVKYRVVILNAKDCITMKQSGMVICMIWTVGFLYAIKAPIVNDLTIIQVQGIYIWACTIDPQYKNINKYFIFGDVFFLFLVPFIIVLFCYIAVVKRLTYETKMATHHNIVLEHNAKAIKMLIILTGLFTVCTLSPMIFKIYLMWGGAYFNNINIVEHVIYMFSYSNSWFNIIVFAIFRDDLRDGFIQMVKSGRLYKLCHHNKLVAETIHVEPRDPKLEALEDNEDKMMAIEF